MRALVTGASGFVGRHTAAELRRRGWDVDPWDISCGRDCLKLFRRDGIRYDLIVHEAASAPHRAAIDGEPLHFARNVQLDASMFDWAVRTGQGRVVYLSSSAVYPAELQQDPLQGRLTEDDVDLGRAAEPDSVYGWTKLTGERLAAAARAAGLEVTVVRPFSGYGEDQSENFPFRAIIERAHRGDDPFDIWGDGTQVRDWIHIDDVVAAMLAVAGSGTTEPVNLCTGIGMSMAELAELACKTAGHSPRFAFRADKPAGVPHRVGDPSRLHAFYEPQISLAEGVERALAGR